MTFYPVTEPVLDGTDRAHLLDAFDSGWISSQGPYLTRFENEFASSVGTEHALATCNGTAALHVALLALGVGPGDEVIVPTFTYVATANAVRYTGATPVLVDCDPDTWNLAPAAVLAAITPRTVGIIAVHLYGAPCDMDKILHLADRYGLWTVEDAAEAHGATVGDRVVGSLADIGTFSFYGNKIITTGEGGMVTTRDPELHARMAMLRDHGMEKGRRYWHLVPGFNYRMTNLQAAIGLAQMERIGDFLTHRARVVARYNERLGPLPGFLLPPCAPWAYNIYWLYSIVIDETEAGLTRDELAAKLAEHGIETRPFFYPVHVQPPYLAFGNGAFPVTERLSARGLSLPTANDIRIEDVDRVCDAIQEIVSHQRVVATHFLAAGAGAA